jgi:hypothetical protein
VVDFARRRWVTYVIPLCSRGIAMPDWGGDVDKSKSTSGWFLLIGNGVVSWSSKKQTIIAQSTMEAEYVSLSEAAKEAIWLKNFFVELAIPESGSKGHFVL